MAKRTRAQIRALHKRDMAARKKKPRTLGRLKTGGYTFTKGARKGQTVRYGAPTRSDSKGRPIYAKRRVITVEGWDGRKLKTTPRLAAQLISSGAIPFQTIG